MSCIICLRDDFTNYKGKDISWSYEGYSETENGEYAKVTECYLSFDGVDDYVQARDASVFDVTTGDFDIEVEYRSTKVLTSVNTRFLDKRGTGSASGAASYQLSAYQNNSFGNTGVTATDGTTVGYAGSDLSTVPYPTDGQWHKVRLTWENATGKLRLYLDGDLKQELTQSGMIGKSITTSRIFTVGTSANLNGQFFEGDIKSFRFGTETFPMNEGTGTTITGSESTVLDIYGATWHCVEVVDFDESCMDGPNPCFDAEGMTPGYYKFTYNYNGEEGDVYLYVSGSEEAGNPVPNTYCFQGLPLGDPEATTINLEDHFLGATQYNIVYHGGVLDQFDGQNLEISSLAPGEYCFTNVAEKQLPEGWKYEDCKDCNDYESVCITIVDPLSAGDNRVINVCNNVDEIFYEDYLVNNDGIGQFSILEDNLTAGTLDSEKYTPDLTDAGSSFKIVHLLPHPVAPNCIGSAILEFHVVDCVPEPECPADEYLGVQIQEVDNEDPEDPQWGEMLVISRTGSYEDPDVIDTDEIYYSYDDGATWIQGTEVKDDDYYVKMTSGFTTTCSGGAQTGSQRVINVTLSDGNNVDEAQLRSANGNFNADWTDIEPSDILAAAGNSTALINERYFRWDIRHVLNSGWVLHITRTHFDRGGSPNACPNGIGTFGVGYYSGHRSGKRKILVERRITYNNGCEPIIIEAEFQPELPECEEAPSGVGFNITAPIPTGGGGWISGEAKCSGSVPGSSNDFVRVYFQATGSPGYGTTTFTCGNTYLVDLGENYIFQRIIEFPDCPPIILLRNYQAGPSCPTATITCTKEDSNGRARAVRNGNPSNLSSDYLQVKVGSANWTTYTEGQWVYVTTSTNIQFRRVANYNNGCSQTTDSCSVTVNPPNHSLTISCVGNNTITYSANNLPPGGTFLLYRSSVVVQANWVGNSTTVTVPGNYEVRYKYNQYLYIYSNVVFCGTGGGCTAPTVSIGQCSVNGTTITIPFTTTNITSINDIDASVTPGSGQMIWSSGSGNGTITVNGTPGQNYFFEIDVENSCGSDYATRNCSVGCSVLTIDSVSCNYGENRTYFSVYVSPDTGTPPTATGATPVGSSGNRYDFYQSGTSGTIQANHVEACSPVSQSISCTCNDPVISLNASCDLNQIQYSFTVSNVQNAGSVFEIWVNGVKVTDYPNTGTSAYIGTRNVPQGSNNTVQVKTTSACGGTVQSSVVNANCGCNDPGISLTASCSTNTINYSFTVTNESQVTSNYSVLLNGSPVQTKVKTNAGTYSGSFSVTPGTNNTVQISASSQCGGNVTSNVSSANCGCPASSLSISNVTCNSTTQVLTFNINQTNVTGLSLTVNGSPESITSNPQTVQGQPGNNTIVVTGTDSCASTNLSDSVNVNCNCTLPSISLSSSCNTSGVIAYNFTVTNEARTSGNYELLIDGSSVATITNTGSGTYSGNYSGTPGTNYTVRIRVANLCGTNTLSNQTTTTCACPSSSVSIANLSCNSTNQNVSFNVNTTNATVTAKYLNGNLITGSGPWAGVIGTNTVTVNATDNCNGNLLSDTKTVTCGCSLLPSVQIDSMSESSGILTVNYSTSNISAGTQITFRGNGVIRPVTNLGSGNWRSTFTLIEGTNTITVQVENNCGTASDNDTYNYTTCVPPSLTKTNETCSNGYLYVYANAQNLTTQDYSTTPSATILGGGSNTIFRFPYGSGNSINWSITGTNDCGSDNISGSSSLCPEVDVVITEDGCSSGGCADYLFLLDNSGSINTTEFINFIQTIQATIDNIEASGIDARYAIAQFSRYLDGPDAAITQTWTSSASTAKNISRWAPDGVAYLSASLTLIRSTGIATRAGCQGHLLIFTDDYTRIIPLDERNIWVSNGWKISVVKYPIGSDNSLSQAQYAATASEGGSYNGSLYSNPGDPEKGATPRRLYLQSGFTGQPIPGLVDDIITTTCTLRANVTGCLSAGSYSWAASNGGSILSGQGTNTITTNGTGSFTVTVTTNGCNIQDTYNF